MVLAAFASKVSLLHFTRAWDLLQLFVLQAKHRTSSSLLTRGWDTLASPRYGTLIFSHLYLQRRVLNPIPDLPTRPVKEVDELSGFSANKMAPAVII